MKKRKMKKRKNNFSLILKLLTFDVNFAILKKAGLLNPAFFFTDEIIVFVAQMKLIINPLPFIIVNLLLGFGFY